MYGAETSTPKKAMVGQLEPDGPPTDGGETPLAASLHAAEAVLDATLKPISRNILLYNQFRNLNILMEYHMCPNIVLNLPKFSATLRTARKELVIAKNVLSNIIAILLKALTILSTLANVFLELSSAYCIKRLS